MCEREGIEGRRTRGSIRRLRRATRSDCRRAPRSGGPPAGGRRSSAVATVANGLRDSAVYRPRARSCLRGSPPADRPRARARDERPKSRRRAIRADRKIAVPQCHHADGRLGSPCPVESRVAGVAHALRPAWARCRPVGRASLPCRVNPRPPAVGRACRACGGGSSRALGTARRTRFVASSTGVLPLRG
jgi:hypothetical protein